MTLHTKQLLYTKKFDVCLDQSKLSTKHVDQSACRIGHMVITHVVSAIVKILHEAFKAIPRGLRNLDSLRLSAVLQRFQGIYLHSPN